MSAADIDVTLALPAGWTQDWEVNEGQRVRAYRPPPPAPGVMRVLTDRIAAAGSDPGSVAVKLREIAVRFVRPDDARVFDRLIEDRPGGGLIATAALIAAQEDGREETHYLWMLAEPGDGASVIAAMAALALPRDDDGEKAAAEVAEAADDALRAARLIRVNAASSCCGACSG